MVFHEITKEAILKALDETRELDTRLVDAQEARRVLDRLVGYSVSPVLWKKIAPKLSAGRVQSVAVRVLVEREWERLDFISASYFDLAATLEQAGVPFEAKMTHLGRGPPGDGKGLRREDGQAQGQERRARPREEQATALAGRLKDAPWRISEVEQKKARRSPAAPFITSTLQQEANRKIGMSARRTMQTAQKLYEQGHITYMRTDSTMLSTEAIEAARGAVEARYGKEYLTPKPAPVRRQGPQRAGGPRGDPPGRHADADQGRARALGRRGQALRPDLEADGRQPDGRGPSAPDARHDPGRRGNRRRVDVPVERSGHRVPGLLPGLRRGPRRSERRARRPRQPAAGTRRRRHARGARPSRRSATRPSRRLATPTRHSSRRSRRQASADRRRTRRSSTRSSGAAT